MSIKHDPVAYTFAQAEVFLRGTAEWLELVSIERLQYLTIIVNLMTELGKNELSLSETDLEFALDYNVSLVASEDKKSMTLKIELETDD